MVSGGTLPLLRNESSIKGSRGSARLTLTVYQKYSTIRHALYVFIESLQIPKRRLLSGRILFQWMRLKIRDNTIMQGTVYCLRQTPCRLDFFIFQAVVRLFHPFSPEYSKSFLRSCVQLCRHISSRHDRTIACNRGNLEKGGRASHCETDGEVDDGAAGLAER